jgi:hypothetical protein
MDILFQDVRFVLRMVAKTPAFAAVSVLTLALGIAANTTIFSWISATILEVLPSSSVATQPCRDANRPH